jgi:hypothetical protein
MRSFCRWGALVLALWIVRPAGAEEPSQPKATSGAKGKATPPRASPAGASPAGASPDKSTRSGTPAATAESEGKPASGVRETVALEIVAKAPKPIPPVELDMLQLRLMLTDLKASFADEIDKALFSEPF